MYHSVANENDDYIWNLFISHAGETFITVRGLPFAYHQKISATGEALGEIVIDRKEKAITRSTILLAYQKAQSLMKKDGCVSGPKMLGVFGASYIYSVFLKLGICRGEKTPDLLQETKINGIMIQGTSSGAGKTFIVTGLCRLFADMGIRVCPFKSQNMSSNSSITSDGLEMSTAQYLQALAARITPQVFMNPILLKPVHDQSSQVILNGKFYAESTKNYRAFTQSTGIETVRRALYRIGENFEAVIIEGAGSPAEVNLNSWEIVNMRIAKEADVPVILVADVDRGGSLASVVGTLELLGQDRKRVKGIIFNMFRGDRKLFYDAVEWTENYTGVRVVGVVPFIDGLNIPEEDSLIRRGAKKSSGHSPTALDDDFNKLSETLHQYLDIDYLLRLIHREGTMLQLQ